jgi:addiction module HigA family antidote
MLPKIEQIRGVHPGYILERELRELRMTKKAFAASIGEYEQVIGEVTKRRRRINPILSLKIDKALNTPQQGYFMLLQTHYDLTQAEKELNKDIHPELFKFRKILFWDTDFDQIDWIKNKRFIIKRIYNRGNKLEIEELTRFYGKEEVERIIAETGKKRIK